MLKTSYSECAYRRKFDGSEAKPQSAGVSPEESSCGSLADENSQPVPSPPASPPSVTPLSAITNKMGAYANSADSYYSNVVATAAAAASSYGYHHHHQAGAFATPTPPPTQSHHGQYGVDHSAATNGAQWPTNGMLLFDYVY